MPWPFKKKAMSKADAAISVLPEAISFASARWQLFNSMIKFKEETGLMHRMQSFMVPFEEGLKAKFPQLQELPPGLLLLIVAKGVEESGTHSTREIEAATGVGLPS